MRPLHFAIENMIQNKIDDLDKISLLLHFSYDKSPVIREVVLEGLSKFNTNQEVIKRVIEMSYNDTSKGIREISYDILQEWEEKNSLNFK